MDNRFTIAKIDPSKTETVVDIFKSTLQQWSGLGKGVPRFAPLDNTIKHICELGALCALIQKNVQDPDFLAEHSVYYARWSYQVSRYCTRIHFFDIEPVSDNPLEVIDQMASQPNRYLGFVTLRPINTSPVGATILSPIKSANHHFILSKDRFRVNLAGQTFEIHGTPFLQQDNAVGACAQASIWMALRTLRRKEGHAAFSPSQITDAATRFLVTGRTLPNRTGLIIEQVTEAVRASGYSPHTIPIRNIGEAPTEISLQHAKTSLHPYIESGIPVLLMLFPTPTSGHAVLLIGHGWGKFKPIELNLPDNWPATNKLFDAASWIEPLYIHNDNTGPYLPLPEKNVNGYTLRHAVSAIPFLPTDVYIDGEEARETCLRLLRDTLISLPGSGLITTPTIEMPQIVLRTYLQDRSAFRESVLNSNMSAEVKEYYRLKWLPKRIWIFEINSFENYMNANEGKSSRLGEILLDPTSEPSDAHFLTIHLQNTLFGDQLSNGGVIIDRDAFNGSITGFPVKENKYEPLLR
jgi:hypothetical protein